MRAQRQQQGSSITWKASGGTYAMTLASLANGAARCGEVADLGANWSEHYTVTAQFNLDVAPTAGEIIELYWAASRDGATFPGGATGTDAAYKAGEVDEWKQQLQWIGSLLVTADADAVVQTQVFDFLPPTRYGCPVVVNKSGVAFEGDDDAHCLTFTPIERGEG